MSTVNENDVIPKLDGVDFAIGEAENTVNDAVSKNKIIKNSLNDRTKKAIMDVPEPIKIGETTYTYTSRPLGYVELIFEELIDLIGDVDTIFNVINERDLLKEDDEDVVTEDDLKKFVLARGKKGFESLIKISQLLLEPIDYSNPKAPDLSSMKLSHDEAKWSMDTAIFAKLISLFVSRDLVPGVNEIKNVMSLSQ